MRPKMKYRTRESIKFRGRDETSNEKIVTMDFNNDPKLLKVKNMDTSLGNSNIESSIDSDFNNCFLNNDLRLGQYDNHIKYITRQKI